MCDFATLFHVKYSLRRLIMKTLSALRALAAATVGASVSPFADIVVSSAWSKSSWAAIFLFHPLYVKNAFSFARSAGRCTVCRNGGTGFWNVCVEIPSPVVPVWPARLLPESKRVRLTRVEAGWRSAEELARPARHESQQHAQARYRERVC